VKVKEVEYTLEAAYLYSPRQKACRLMPLAATKRTKRFHARYKEGGTWTPNQGPDPWPLWREAEAITAAQSNPGHWLLETEGEKAAEIARDGGLAAVSQPGNAHKPEQIQPRYAALVAAGVGGVVFLADMDITGLKRAQDALDAAAAVGLPLVVLPASNVWPNLPEGGSIDDARGTPPDRVAALEKEISLIDPSEWAGIWVKWRQEMLTSASDGAIQLGSTDSVCQTVASALDALLGPAAEGKLRRPRNDKLTNALGMILPLRYNLLTGRIERNGEAIHGDYLGGLYLELAEEHQLDITKDRAIDAAIRVARKNAYHPVRDYLNGIEVTLPPEDWAAIDLRCFGREDPTGMSGLHLQRQLIGLVARAMDPGCGLQTALVLHSDRQGVGKSSFWRILGGDWFSDSLGDLRNIKDDLLQLHAAWIHEWGEIDMVMGKQESESLKRFLSACRDDVRKPYGRGVETLLRSCGVVGTTNRRDFIKDPTGNRRFPIISINSVDLGWVAANRNAIWGSALAAYHQGTRWQYDNHENALVSANALAFAPDDPLRESIEAWAEDNPTVMIAPLQLILKKIGRDTDDMSVRRQAGHALTSLGWIRDDAKQRFELPWGERTNTTYGWRRPA
jgi:predicted P-loop ATPase